MNEHQMLLRLLQLLPKLNPTQLKKVLDSAEAYVAEPDAASYRNLHDFYNREQAGC